MDIAQIKKLIQLLNDNNLGELKVQEGDFKITIRHRDYAKTSGVASVVSAPTASAAAPQASAPAATEVKKEMPSGNFQTVKAPMIGTFYRAAGEGKEPFVKVGDKVKKGDVFSMPVIEKIKPSDKLYKIIND